MLETTIQSIQEKIRDSHLREILSAELTDLLARKPAGARTDEYMAAVAVLVLKELKSELLNSAEMVPPSHAEEQPTPPLDCETIIKGLLIGMHHDLLESNLQMVKALGSAIAERDYGTSEHNFRVTVYAIKLAEKAGVDNEQMKALIKGSFLHDIGKIGIRDNTLLKPAQLSNEEFESVKKHVLHGRHIIESVTWLEDAIDVVLYHHENWDGSGYPHGLSGESIPLVARIFCIADVFDALTSDRPYKKAWSYEETMAIMAKDARVRFDPSLLRDFGDISGELYRTVVPLDAHSLEDRLLQIINHYFHFSPTIEDLRESFGSITRRGDETESRR